MIFKPWYACWRTSTATRQAEINRLKSGVRSTDVAHVLEDLIDYLDNQIKRVEQLIKSLIDRDDDLSHAKSFYSSVFLGLVKKQLTRSLGNSFSWIPFENARQVAAYAGLNPRQRLSGKFKGHSSISKTGNAHLRKAMYFPAIVAKGCNPVIRDFCARMKDNGLVPMEVIVAAMRKLLHMAFGVLKNDAPFDPLHEMGLQDSLHIPVSST